MCLSCNWTTRANPVFKTQIGPVCHRIQWACWCGSRGGEMGEFSPPPSPLPFIWVCFFPFFITSTRLWFYYIITKIHPPFQNPGSAPGVFINQTSVLTFTSTINWKFYQAVIHCKTLDIQGTNRQYSSNSQYPTGLHNKQKQPCPQGVLCYWPVKVL